MRVCKQVCPYCPGPVFPSQETSNDQYPSLTQQIALPLPQVRRDDDLSSTAPTKRVTYVLP